MDKDFDKAVKDRLTETALRSTAHKVRSTYTDRIISSEVIISAVITECGKRKDIDSSEIPAHRSSIIHITTEFFFTFIKVVIIIILHYYEYYCSKFSVLL